jgi:hypothetical protein
MTLKALNGIIKLIMSQLSPFAQFFIDEIRDIYAEENVPDHIHVEALTKVLLTDDAPPHVVALVKELKLI